MFNSLNEEIKKNEGTSETSTAQRLLLYAAAVAGAIFAMWALYAAVLYLE
jgi:hypothetical protein